MLFSSSTFLNAETIGLVMSLAKPQSAKRLVMRMKGIKRLLGTTGIFLLVVMCLRLEAQNNQYCEPRTGIRHFESDVSYLTIHRACWMRGVNSEVVL